MPKEILQKKIVTRLAQWLHAERSRHILWCPVLLGVGMAMYFALQAEPSPYAATALLLVAITQYYWRKRWRKLWAIAILPLAGFCLAQFHAGQNDTVMLTKELRGVMVEGRVVALGNDGSATKLTLDHVRMDRLPLEETPQKIRLSLRGAPPGLLTGQRISLRAGLLPPAGPVMPHSFDFRRFFFFKNIGAVGYGLPPVTVLENSDEADMYLTTLRAGLTQRILAQMSREEGAVAAALMTGDASYISEEVNNAMRATNLSHILSISGMHMVLVSGVMFIALRYLLLAIPYTRHLLWAKPLAAFGALLATTGYLLLSGMPVSACRAYIMVLLVLIALLLNRRVAPMRSLAFAALLLLAFDPSHLLEPGFQLSFGATAALIAWFEAVRRGADHALEDGRFRLRIGLYIGGVLATSLVAEAATLPLVLAHFNSISWYGILANLLVAPLVSFVIMPAIIFAFMMLPLGLEAWPLMIAEWGIHWMIACAQWAASLPYAQIWLPTIPTYGFALLVLGGLWLLIWRKWPRWLGLIGIAAGMVTLLLENPPDLLISPDGKQVAARIKGEMHLIKGRPASFTPQLWANGLGLAELPRLAKDDPAWRCDPLGCVLTMDGLLIAMPTVQEALPQDCAKAALVIAPFYVSEKECRGPLIVDRYSVAQQGAQWFALRGKKLLKSGSSAEEQGERLWAR